MKPNSEILANMKPTQKADIALADIAPGGILLPEPAQQFMQLAIYEQKLLPMAYVKPMTAPNDIVPRIGFSQRVLRPAQEATALPAADRSKPDFSNVELVTKPFVGEVRIPDTVLDDNIERDQLKNTIMTLMTKAIGRDLEQLAILGDTASTDTYLAQFDGALKLATSHVVDAGLARLNRDVLTDMVKTLPNIYQAQRPQMMFLTSTNAAIDWNNSIGSRQTPTGDDAVLRGGIPPFLGARVEDVPLFPQNLGGGSNATDVLYMDPKNLTVGFWKTIKVETARDVSARVTIIVVSLRVGLQYALEDAIVKAINVKAQG